MIEDTSLRFASGLLYAPDGRRIVAGSFEGSTSVWDVQSGKRLVRLSTPGWNWAFVFSPDGHRLLLGGTNQVTLWHAGTYRRLLSFSVPSETFDVNFSPDGTKIIAACKDGTVRVWDATEAPREELRR